jgi:hypothetical protein
MDEWLILQSFYNGLKPLTRSVCEVCGINALRVRGLRQWWMLMVLKCEIRASTILTNKENPYLLVAYLYH